VNTNDAIVGFYRALQRLYPRAFREEYADDMVSLLGEQLRDEPPWRVCGRGVVDLAVAVPTRHVEVHMSRNRAPALVMLMSVALASAVFVLVEGALGLAVAGLGTALGMLIWRRERPAIAERGAAARWWKLLLSGAVVLATVIAITTVTGELSEPAWLVAAAALLVSVVLLGAGTVLGLVRLADRHHSNRPRAETPVT
jgi:hypothetical protein